MPEIPDALNRHPSTFHNTHTGHCRCTDLSGRFCWQLPGHRTFRPHSVPACGFRLNDDSLPDCSQSSIPDDVYLLSPSVLKGILKLKQKTSYKSKYSLNLSEVLIALSICAENNPVIEKTIEALDSLRGADAHSSYMISGTEQKVLKSLGINLTCEPKMLGYDD